MPSIFSHHRWVCFSVLLLTVSPLQAELCDSFNRCLSDIEVQAYERAMELYQNDQKQLAISLMGEMYHESSSNQVLANNYAAMLSGVGRIEEALLVLEDYMLNETKVSTATKNLFTSYQNMSLRGTNAEGQVTELDFIEPTPRGLASNLMTQRQSAQIVDIPDTPVDNPVSSEEALKEVRWQLSQFLAAWSSGEHLDYFSYFVPNQSPISGISYDTWRLQRMARVTPSRNISVKAEDVSVRQSGDNIVTDFTQHYYSRNYQDTSLKQLVWINTDSGWKILRELQR